MEAYGHYLRILHCIHSQAITSALAEMELTSSQGGIIGYLAHCQQPPCPRDLEEFFHQSHPTVSGLLARLEKKAFLELKPDPDDRRCKRIFLLQKGQECHERIQSVILENEKQIVRGFTEEEQAQFLAFLHRAAQNLGSEPGTHTKEETNE